MEPSDDIVGVPGERSGDELRIYLIVRADIEMPVGKAMAQAGHAFLGVIEAARRINRVRVAAYFAGQQAKIAIQAKSLDALQRAADECREIGLPVCVVTDAGRTIFAEPTVTCMAVGPVKRDELPKFVQRMRLL